MWVITKVGILLHQTSRSVEENAEIMWRKRSTHNVEADQHSLSLGTTAATTHELDEWL